MAWLPLFAVGGNNPLLAWTSGSGVSTPTFSTSWPDILFVGDVITLQQAADTGFTGATTYTHTITMQDVINNAFAYGNAALSSGVYYFRTKDTRASVDITGWSNTVTVTIA